MKKIIRFPVGYKQRMINQKGTGYVPCEVSSRWLQFPEEIADSRYVPIKVMTNNGEKDKTLCELIISHEDLVRAVNSIKLVKTD